MKIYENFDNKNNIYFCYADISDVDINEHINDFSLYRLKKIERLKNEKAKKQSAGAELMLINAVKKNFGNFKLPVEYDADEFGKTYFTNTKNIFFNLSHSGNVSACIISDSPVGIDVQIERPVNMGIAKRYFTDNEFEYLNEFTDNKKLIFNTVWTRKEAVSKAIGKGLSVGISGIDVLKDIVRYNGASYLTYSPDIEYKGYYLSVSKLIF